MNIETILAEPPGPWVLLYSAGQDAYHIETLEEYRCQPTNGYRIVELTETYDEAARRHERRRGILHEQL